MPRIDWRVIRGSIALFALTLILGGVTAAGATRFSDRMTLDHEQQKGRLGSIRTRHRTIDEQRRLIETWLPAFRALEASGVVGEERRLEWIETLRDVAARARLPSLRYRIERRTVHETGLPLETAVYRPFSTVVRLEAGLLHEGDFVRLVREVEARSAGLHRIDRCLLRRAGPHFVMRPGAINLVAECDLRWITLARAGAQT